MEIGGESLLPISICTRSRLSARFGRHVGRKGVPVQEWLPKGSASSLSLKSADLRPCSLELALGGFQSVGAFVLERNF